MGKKSRNGKSKILELGNFVKAPAAKISPETKKSILAILLLGVAVLLVLSSVDKAGPAGAYLFRGLSSLFGLGYYIIPALLFLIAALFFLSKEEAFLGMTFIGGAFLTLCILGLIDILFPERGGLVGKAIGLIESPFGKIAGIVLLLTLTVIAALITFNVSIKFPKREKSEDYASDEEEILEPVIAETNRDQDRKTREDTKGEKAEEEAEEETEMVEPVIAEPAVATTKLFKKVQLKPPKNYVPPPLSLLKSSVEKPTSGDLRANANIIKRTLDGFGIAVEMGEISIGPKVTRYTLKPAEGVKLSRITALNQDLALALAAHPIRIEAPIPGKSLVGIEVPNKAAAIVRLGSLMAYQDFMNSGPLGFPLGRDVSGEPIFVDIEKMPHMLIAGATGSGKSICIHSVLISLLYKNSPETLRLILIDPKRVELSIYDGIPHLVAPVITETKKTVGVFRWAIEEMERRYEILLKAGSRDVKSYNKNGGAMPYLLIVIDELADLMATYGREVESSIVRLAQMARATGIHLMVSTQRPSVEVITGLIKANITARIALQVASQVDSRTILDMAGAEKLLGGGDLLFISSEFSKPKRIQGAYLSEEEIKSVTEFIGSHNENIEEDGESINEAVSELSTESKADPFEQYMGDSSDEDELLEEALAVVREAKKASASLLQRRLKVGYARAARLLDIMEEKGIVGPGDGAKPREILIE